MTTSSADHLGGFSMSRHGMGEIARLFAADASDLETWSRPLRAKLARDPAGGWQSAAVFGLDGAITRQRDGLNSAETLLRVVARDLELMAGMTQWIADHFARSGRTQRDRYRADPGDHPTSRPTQCRHSGGQPAPTPTASWECSTTRSVKTAPRICSNRPGHGTRWRPNWSTRRACSGLGPIRCARAGPVRVGPMLNTGRMRYSNSSRNKRNRSTRRRWW